MQPSNQQGYRPEIDGLRAVAVVGVVLFHAGFGIPGGYVGVDVFFVISGYLITSIIAKDLEAERFTLRQFWTRRIRRILPASTFLVAVVAIASFLLLEPSDFVQVMRSAFWQAAMVSNYFFSQDVGYFAERAELKPLLHTWSLAVEEQFYIVFPPLLVIYRRYVSKSLLPPILALAAIFLAISVWQTPRDQSSAFFLLPARAWELLAGASIALMPLKHFKGKTLPEVVSGLGATLIVVAMLAFSKQTPFPGWAAMIPVGGTVAIIVSCSNRQTLVGKFLSQRLFLIVGRMSYSIYLWHWPLIAFANLLLVEVGFGTRVALGISSVLLAIPSYTLIEQKFRHRSILNGQKRAFCFAAVSMVSTLLISEFAVKSNGFPQLMSESTRTLIEDISWHGSEFSCIDGKPILLGSAKSNDAVDFVLWGDSHAMVYSSVIDKIAKELRLKGEGFTLSGTPPIPGVCRPYSKYYANFTAFNEATKESILTSGARSVILVSRWEVWCSGFSKLEIESGQSRRETLLAPVNTQTSNPEFSTATLDTYLRKLLVDLTKAGIEVWVIQQVPECDSLTPARDFCSAKRISHWNSTSDLRSASVSIHEHLQRQDSSRRVISEAAVSPLVHVIDPTAGFFDEDGILQVFSERSHYRDNHHLTSFGASTMLGRYLREILLQVAENAHAGDLQPKPE